jgi:sRNA-binding regulator protein Hfq
MTYIEDMKRESDKLSHLFADPQPGLMTWLEAVDKVMKRLNGVYKAPEAVGEPVAKAEQPHTGPNFINRLRKHHVLIELTKGESIQGDLLRFNRYEILLKVDSTKDDPPIVLMKHAIESITPLDGNPFEEKKEAEVKVGEGIETATAAAK